MALTSPQKKRLAEKRRDQRANQIVGRFFRCWNLFEEDLGYAIKRICDLKTIDGAIILANQNFQSKMSIIISMVELYTRDKDEKWRDNAKKLFNRAFDINIEWRNVIAHNTFSANDDRSIRFMRIQAKRSLKIPKYEKTPKDFEAICKELTSLGLEIGTLVEEAYKTKRLIERERLTQPKLSLAQLGTAHLPQSPLQGLMNYQPPTTVGAVQTPVERVARALMQKPS